MKTTATSATALASAANVHALVKEAFDAVGASFECSAPGSLDTSLSHAAGLIEIAACHA